MCILYHSLSEETGEIPRLSVKYPLIFRESNLRLTVLGQLLFGRGQWLGIGYQGIEEIT